MSQSVTRKGFGKVEISPVEEGNSTRFSKSSEFLPQELGIIIELVVK
jgi:hypothetical protein